MFEDAVLSGSPTHYSFDTTTTTTTNNNNNKQHHDEQKYDPQLFLENARNFQLTKVPCAKDSLFQGALGGATVGVVRFIRTKYIGSAVSWSIGGFVASSLISLEICRRTRENHEAKLREAKQAMQQFRETQSGKQLPYSQDRGISHE